MTACYTPLCAGGNDRPSHTAAALILYTQRSMLRITRWKVIFAAGLVLLAAALYAVQLLIFRDPHSTLFYLLQDVAFLPISVLVVTVIVAEALEWRERSALLHRLNMIIGAFFSETGYDLLRRLLAFDPGRAELTSAARPQPDWERAQFAAARRTLATWSPSCDARAGDLAGLGALLREHRHFMLALVENPGLLEHERFTELMWAVLHVDDELAARDSLTDLGAADLEHLGLDIGRAYTQLVRQWLDYMEHLSRHYPFLYSLAVRTSPLAQDATSAAIAEPAGGPSRATPESAAERPDGVTASDGANACDGPANS
jgi:hypothetical protein